MTISVPRDCDELCGWDKANKRSSLELWVRSSSPEVFHLSIGLYFFIITFTLGQA